MAYDVALSIKVAVPREVIVTQLLDNALLEGVSWPCTEKEGRLDLHVLEPDVISMPTHLVEVRDSQATVTVDDQVEHLLVVKD